MYQITARTASMTRFNLFAK